MDNSNSTRLENLLDWLVEVPQCRSHHHHHHHHSIESSSSYVDDPYFGLGSVSSDAVAKLRRRRNDRQNIAASGPTVRRRQRKGTNSSNSSGGDVSTFYANESFGRADWSSQTYHVNHEQFSPDSYQQSQGHAEIPPRSSSLAINQKLAFLNSDPYGEPRDDHQTDDEAGQTPSPQGSWKLGRSGNNVANSARDSLILGSPIRRKLSYPVKQPCRNHGSLRYRDRAITFSSTQSNTTSRSSNSRRITSADGRASKPHSANSSVSSISRHTGEWQTCSSNSVSRQTSLNQHLPRSCSAGSDLRTENSASQHEHHMSESFDFDFGSAASAQSSPKRAARLGKALRSSRYLAQRVDSHRKRQLSRQLSRILDLKFETPGFDQQFLEILDQLQEIEEECAQYAEHAEQDETLVDENFYPGHYDDQSCNPTLCDCAEASILCDHVISEDFRSFQQKSGHQRFQNQSISSTRCNLHVPRGRLHNRCGLPRQSSSTLPRYNSYVRDTCEDQSMYEDSIWASRDIKKLPPVEESKRSLEYAPTRPPYFNASTTSFTSAIDTSSASFKHTSKTSSFSRPFKKEDDSPRENFPKLESNNSHQSQTPITPPQTLRPRPQNKMSVKPRNTASVKASLPSLGSFSTLSISTMDLFPTPPSAMDKSRNIREPQILTSPGGLTRTSSFILEEDLVDDASDIESTAHEVCEAKPVTLISPRKNSVVIRRL